MSEFAQMTYEQAVAQLCFAVDVMDDRVTGHYLDDAAWEAVEEVRVWLDKVRELRPVMPTPEQSGGPDAL